MHQGLRPFLRLFGVSVNIGYRLLTEELFYVKIKKTHKFILIDYYGANLTCFAEVLA